MPTTTLILGLGDSGLAMARWLARSGEAVRVWDSRAEPPQAAALAEHVPSATVLSAPLDEAALAGIKRVLKSPGLSPTDDRIAALLAAAHAANFPVQGELDLFVEALDALRIRGARTDALTTAAGVRDFVDTLAWVGSRATWAARFAPLQLPGADPGTCAVGRWSHVSREDVGLIASEYRTLVHRRMEVPMPYTPPAREGGLRGCLLCGVGSIVTTESLAADAWGSLERVQTGTIGGANRASSARGHLCPNCRAAVEQVGAPGMSAVERALMNHLGFKVRYGSTVNFTDESVVHGWAALPPGTPANDEPWAHLDLPRITRALQVEYYAEPIAESAR